MSQHNTVCVVGLSLASTRNTNPESLSILLFNFWHIHISSDLFVQLRLVHLID